MKKSWISFAMLLALLAPLLLSPAQPLTAHSRQQYSLADCSELAFSTEEDFVSEEGIVISDGDLLGANCQICARNADLVGRFGVEAIDLGLDAVDVLNVESYLVAFSTELDSPPSATFFTAGDLLFTNMAIIPNRTLTQKFDIGYDIGLDAVHLVGEDIEGFLDDIAQYDRSHWETNPGELFERLEQYDVDIWFSTEGTADPLESPRFLDGDLLSARFGVIIVGNANLLPPAVPAGIPLRGVDFGLDAVSSSRMMKVGREMRYSTEILYEDQIAFTDGDILEYGTGNVVTSNATLLSCFNPPASFLGLDALSQPSSGQEEPCNKITKIGEINVDDISSIDGLIGAGFAGIPAINAPAPFGGNIPIRGTICNDVQEFRVVYREKGSPSPWTPMAISSGSNWTVDQAPFCSSGIWSSDANGWFDGPLYRANDACSDLEHLTVWATAGKNELYEVMLVTKSASGIFSGTVHSVQLDNIAPQVQLEKTAGTTQIYRDTDMPISVSGRITDSYFYRAQITLLGDGYGSTKKYDQVTYYDNALDNLITTGTLNWNAYMEIPTSLTSTDVNVSDLSGVSAANTAESGYCVQLYAWDRTQNCGFNFTNNTYYCIAGRRYADDGKGFIFDSPGNGYMP